MRVFVAGATGVLGRLAVASLVRAGHEVTGVARSDEKANALGSLGASAARVDPFDPDALRTAVHGNDAVCNFATHIPRFGIVLRSAWRTNDRLHAEVSRNLVEAALAGGAKTYLQHSSGFMYADGVDRWLDEDTPFDPPPHGLAIEEAERQAARFAGSGGNGVAMRFGFFYGPDAQSTRDQLMFTRIRFAPVPGKPDAFFPAIHTEDLGPSVVAALAAPSGAFNVTDDDPLTRGELAEIVAGAMNVKRLRPTPMPLQRLGYIARSQRTANRRFKDVTGWKPTVRSGREGWPGVISALRTA